MAQTTENWRVYVLEEARLQPPGGEALWLDRRSAALLAWLAWEGPSDRSVVGGTLWPSSPEQTARANLRQLISRLHKLAGREVVESRGPLRLRPDIEVDLILLRDGANEGSLPLLLRAPSILPGVDCSAIPEFEAWLGAVNETLRRLLWNRLFSETERQIGEGDYERALRAIEAALVVDPLSERGHRRLIELHHRMGDRAAALRAFQTCERILREELDVSPAPETVELAARLSKGGGETKRGPLPSRLLHPPRLIGREAELRRIADALQKRRIVFLQGPSGIGKTRLIHELFRRWPHPTLIFEGRPADLSIPYATHLRAIRQVQETVPKLELEAWVKQDLSRLFPDRAGSEGGEPPPADGTFSKLAFSEANVEFMRALAKSEAVFAVDDMQFHDPETLRLETYMLSSRIHADFSIGSIISLRADLPEELLRTAERVVEAGDGDMVELEELGEEARRAFVASLDLPSDLDPAPALETAGGNPGAILEALSHLF